MNLFPVFADISPLPFVLAGGMFLLVIGGVILAIAVALFAYVKRRRDQRRADSSLADERSSEGATSQK